MSNRACPILPDRHRKTDRNGTQGVAALAVTR
jgi:hypothetical protein